MMILAFAWWSWLAGIAAIFIIACVVLHATFTWGGHSLPRVLMTEVVSQCLRVHSIRWHNQSVSSGSIDLEVTLVDVPAWQGPKGTAIRYVCYTLYDENGETRPKDDRAFFQPALKIGDRGRFNIIWSPVYQWTRPILKLQALLS